MATAATEKPGAPLSLRLPVFYRTAGALLRELSRAVSRGQTRIRAQTGLPSGTRITLALATATSGRPVEVTGTITSLRRRANLYEMGLRYDFEPKGQQASLDRIIARLRREESPRRRRDPRVPLAIAADAAAFPGLAVNVENLSRTGCRLEMRGRRLPPIVPGSRVSLALRGGRPPRSLRFALDVRWVGHERKDGRELSLLIGGRFEGVDAALRDRLAAVLGFRECRPAIRVAKVAPPKPR
jgi:hypothetical protein